VTWPEGTRLSVYDGGGYPVAPERAYRGIPTEFAIAAAMVDAEIWGVTSWLADIVAWRSKETPAVLHGQTAAWMKEHDCQNTNDVYAAAGLTERQRQVMELHIFDHTSREIGGWLSIAAPTVRVHVFDALAKLRGFAGLNTFCGEEE
jgi:DNA-binding CsgD family transcriptional regulator